MKKLSFAAAALVVAAALSARAADEKKEAAAPAAATVTMTGEVLDLSCYLGHGAMGKEHKDCGKACILNKHAAAGLLAADGKVYVLIADHESEKEFHKVGEMCGEKAKITGTKSDKGGLNAILVSKVEKP